MSRPVLKTLAAYLDIVEPIVAEDLQEKRPVGALCMAMQAVCFLHHAVSLSSDFLQVNRALEYLLTGRMRIPEDTSSQFLKENWGNYEMEKELNGKTVVSAEEARLQGSDLGCLTHLPAAVPWAVIIIMIEHTRGFVAIRIGTMIQEGVHELNTELFVNIN